MICDMIKSQVRVAFKAPLLKATSDWASGISSATFWCSLNSHSILVVLVCNELSYKNRARSSKVSRPNQVMYLQKSPAYLRRHLLYEVNVSSYFTSGHRSHLYDLDASVKLNRSLAYK